jgi:putative oxidoreductase
VIAYGIIAARLCLAVVFLYSGIDKLWHWQSGIDEVRGYGLPFPKVCATLTIITQLYGGVLVATGYEVWLGALLLGGFTVAATMLGHRFWLYRGEQFRRELTTTLEHVAIIGGFLLIAILDFTSAI